MVAALLGLIIYILEWLASPLRVYPDCEKYAAMALGQKTCAPFNRRWGLPFMLKANGHAWRFAQMGFTVLLAWSTARYCGTPWAAWFMLLLPIVWLHAECPLLVDIPSLALAVTSAVAWQSGEHTLAIAFSLLAGACKEPGPIFAAIFAGNPILLVGLLAVRWWGAIPYEGPDVWLGKNMPELVAKNWWTNRPDWRNKRYMFLHWGALTPLLFWNMAFDRATIIAILALGAAWGQTWIAADRTRLVQWAAPAVIAVAVKTPALLPLAAAIHLLTPREHANAC